MTSRKLVVDFTKGGNLTQDCICCKAKTVIVVDLLSIEEHSMPL